VLIKLEKTAICGTDLHIYKWDEWSQRTIKPGLVIGHEFVGRIVEMGARRARLQLGDRVSAEGHIVCGVCRNCRAGRQHLCPQHRGHRCEPQWRVRRVHRDAGGPTCGRSRTRSPDELAAFFDPYGNAAHCALEFDVIGEDVLITGAGPIGIIAAGICKHVGARATWWSPTSTTTA
jgi:threonine 3-dehydrogenase